MNSLKVAIYYIGFLFFMIALTVFAIVTHIKYILKVNSDNAGVPRTFTVLVFVAEFE